MMSWKMSIDAKAALAMIRQYNSLKVACEARSRHESRPTALDTANQLGAPAGGMQGTCLAALGTNVGVLHQGKSKVLIRG